MPDAVSLPRYLLDEIFPGNPRAVAAFEALVESLAQASSDSATATAAAGDIQGASFVVLSANASLSGERVLTQGDGVSIAQGDGTVTISADTSVARKSGVGRLVFTIAGSSNVAVPSGGTLATRENAETLAQKTLAAPSVSGINEYADDAAAATGGVSVGGVYRTASALKVRVV